MKQKPIIRHCNNCQWYKENYYPELTGTCMVKYVPCFDARAKALFCRFYTKKEDGNGNEADI